MREKIPDKQEALNMIESSKKDLEFTLSLNATEASANTIIRNVYECFRMLGEALLIKKGLIVSDHIAMINELTELKLETPTSLNNLNNLRKIRHNINYYSYRASSEEAQIILDFARKNFPLVFKEVKRIIET